MKSRHSWLDDRLVGCRQARNYQLGRMICEHLWFDVTRPYFPLLEDWEQKDHPGNRTFVGNAVERGILMGWAEKNCICIYGLTR